MPDCNNCKSTKEPVAVPYIVHESAMARMERQAKRMWVIILVLILLLVGTNCAWLYYESQFEYVETSTVYEADATDGGNAIANGEGSVVINGESKGHNNDTQESS